MLKDGAPAREPPLNCEVANEDFPIEEAGGLPPLTSRHSFTFFGAQRTRPPNKLILGSYVKLLEWSRPLQTCKHLIRKMLGYLSENAIPSTSGILRSHTYAISTPSTFASQWWLILRSTPSPSPATWIRGLIDVWQKMRCISAITTSMRRPSWYGPTSNV